MQRRHLLKTLGGLGMASALPMSGLTAEQVRQAPILVAIELSGGNDGLNTVVPFRNDIYYENRPKLGLGKEEVLQMNDELGLHPSLEGMMNLYILLIIDEQSYFIRQTFIDIDLMNEFSSESLNL